MARQLFSFKRLGKIDCGSILESFDRRVQQAARDCIDRPQVKTAREVVLVVRMVPVPEIRGSTIDCDHVKTEFEVRMRSPCERSRTLIMEPTQAGLAFNPDDPDEPDGQTLFDSEERADDDDQDPAGN